MSEARALSPAIIVGFVLPSTLLFLLPTSARVPLNTKQILAALWQPFPIYISVGYNILSKANHDIPSSGSVARISETTALPALQRPYLFSGVLSTVAHWVILIPSVFASDPKYNFLQIFVPYPLHAAMGAAPAHVAPYRLSIRLLFQNDWVTTTIAAFAFFFWTHSRMVHTIEPAAACSSERTWLLKVSLLTLVGGPGASIAWAALDRERLISNFVAVSTSYLCMFKS